MDFDKWKNQIKQEKEVEQDQLLDDNIWMTSDGKGVHISELDNYHLNNILQWLNDNDFYRGDEWIKIIKEEIKQRNGNLFV